MKKVMFYLILLITIVSCSQVLITGRKQLSLVSDAEILTMSLQSYKHFIDSVPLSTDKANTSSVKKVGARIAEAVENYLRQNGQEDQLKNFSWEFNLVKDPSVNAFCMPGGKVVFFEGILPMTKTEAGMAVVMGHEIAHAVAKHSNERLSQQLAVSFGASLTDILLSGQSNATRMGVSALYGLGSQFGVVLPYSRKHEYEADELGLIFMSMAGYNPNEAIAFWERMSANDSEAVMEFMSTHPSNANRITQMKRTLPVAIKYYQAK